MMNVKSTNIPVLFYLSDENYITGEELSGKLGFSRVAVWKQVQKLKKLGYHISADARKGYRVISRPDILLPAEIQNNLHTKYIGKRIYYYDRVNSTNSVAKNVIKNQKIHLPEGTVIVTDMQTAGRGRLGRIWYSPHGGIWLTIVLFPNLEPAYLSKITLMTAVVLVRSIKSLYDIPVHIKWPNDLLIEKKKLCGILSEMTAESDRINYVLVGIGVNANIRRENFPEDIREQSTSLQEILGELISRIRLVQVMLENFEKYYDKLKKKQFKPILKEWKENTDTLGKKITIESAGQTIAGEAVDITPEGALILRKENGKSVHVLSGTVR